MCQVESVLVDERPILHLKRVKQLVKRHIQLVGVGVRVLGSVEL